MSESTTTSPVTKFLAWCFGIAGIFMLISAGSGGGGSASASQASGDRSETNLVMEACSEAQRAVKASLKAPASAKFPGCVMGAHEYTINTNEARDKFSVRGHVDAQNDFGAMIRSEFIVILSRSGDSWTATRVAVE